MFYNPIRHLSYMLVKGVVVYFNLPKNIPLIFKGLLSTATFLISNRGLLPVGRVLWRFRRILSEINVLPTEVRRQAFDTIFNRQVLQECVQNGLEPFIVNTLIKSVKDLLSTDLFLSLGFIIKILT